MKRYIKKRYSGFMLRGETDQFVPEQGTAVISDPGRKQGPGVPADGYLVDQAAGPEGRYRYGITRTAQTGCEIIAVYNLLRKYGKQVAFGELVRRFDRRGGGRVFLGLFGSSVYGMQKQLNRAGLPVKCIPGDQTHEMDRAEAGILTFWWSEKSLRIHTVMIEKTGSGRRVTAYNYMPWKGASRITDSSVSELIKRRRIQPIAFLAVEPDTVSD